MSLMIPERPALTVTAAIILVGSGLLFWNTFGMLPSILPGYPGDAFFPRIVLAFIALFAAWVMFNGLWKRQESVAGATPAEGRFQFDLIETAVVFALTFGYVVLLHPLGYEIATTLLLFILLERRLLMPVAKRLLVAAFASVTSMLLIYAVFVVGLNVFMPLRFLPAYIGF